MLFLLITLIATVLGLSSARWERNFEHPRKAVLKSAKDCSNSDHAIEFRTVKIVPDPPILGEKGFLNATQSVVHRPVNGGDLVFSVTFADMPLYSTIVDVCGDSDIELPLGFGTVNMKSLPCPVSPGQKPSVFMTVLLPVDVPTGGTYEIILESEGVYCLNLSFDA